MAGTSTSRVAPRSSLEQYDAAARERLVPELPKRVDAPERTPFERDRARVVHAASFRRLAAKTQVVGPHTDDFVRNRLTHSLEVAQVSRDLVATSETSSMSAFAGERQEVLSRSQSRREIAKTQEQFEVNAARAATQRAVRNADTKRWTTVDLNLWTLPGEDARKVGVLDAGKRVLVTGRVTPERVEIVWKGESRWVTAGYLSEDKPVGGGSLSASCTNGTAVPSGVSPNVVAVHEAVCANFPEITTYGTFRGDGEHSQGIAVDIMVSGERGWEVAGFVRAHYAELGVSYLIYAQRIWSVERAGEGWRAMSDRGSATANHYDHVHVTTY